MTPHSNEHLDLTQRGNANGVAANYANATEFRRIRKNSRNSQRLAHHFHIALVCLLAVLLAGCATVPGPAAAPDLAITLGAPTAIEATLPLHIAQEQGFFARHGLTVTLRDYDSGLAALNGLLQGETDVAGPMSEYALAGHALAGAPVQALASIDRLDFTFLVARKDHGISRVADLRGKRVALAGGTSSEFYLGRFLELNGVAPTEVGRVDSVTQAAATAWVVQGVVDAMVAVEPYPSQAAAQLGDLALVWPAQSSQPVYALLVSRRDWLSQRLDASRRLLAALDDASAFIAHNPEAARRTAATKLGLSNARLATVWPRNRFGLTLDMALVIAMEDEARWMIQNGLADGKPLPDFGAYVYADALQAVKPNAVTLIR